MANNQESLDRILRQKLEGSPVPAQKPEDWARLEAALDADIDLDLKTRLSGLVTEKKPAGWELLERKLGSRTAADLALAATLTSITPAEAPAGSWNVLSDKLDESLGKEVDAIVERKLRQEHGTVSGWATLAARLELISNRRHLIGAWKVTEFGLLASLLLLLLRFGPVAKEQVHPLAEEGNGFPIQETTTDLIKENTSSVSLASASKEDAEEAEEAPLQAAETASPAYANPENTEDGARKSHTVTPIPSPVYQATILQLAPEAVPSATEPLAGLTTQAEWFATLPSPALDLPKIDNSIPVRYYLNLFVSPIEVNQVITPQSTVGTSDIVGRSELTNSFSAGALLDISKGNDGLQIGAIYGVHAYRPTALTRNDCIVEGNCPEGYNRFVYHSVSFPFSYERSLLNRNDWRIATRVGMAMSVITQSEFRLTSMAEEDLEEALFARPAEGDTRRRSASTNNIPSHQVLDPEPGWFEGGSLLANASFYLQTGFTVERMINPRFSVYVSPSYGRVIYLRDSQGVGPYNDRIHRANLRLGSRFLLSRK